MRSDHRGGGQAGGLRCHVFWLFDTGKAVYIIPHGMSGGCISPSSRKAKAKQSSSTQLNSISIYTVVFSLHSIQLKSNNQKQTLLDKRKIKSLTSPYKHHSNHTYKPFILDQIIQPSCQPSARKQSPGVCSPPSANSSRNPTPSSAIQPRNRCTPAPARRTISTAWDVPEAGMRRGWRFFSGGLCSGRRCFASEDDASGKGRPKRLLKDFIGFIGSEAKGVWEPELWHWDVGVGPVKIVGDVHLEIGHRGRGRGRRREMGKTGKTNSSDD